MAQRLKCMKSLFSGNFLWHIKSMNIYICLFMHFPISGRKREKRERKINNDELKINFFHFFFASWIFKTLEQWSEWVSVFVIWWGWMAKGHFISYITRFLFTRSPEQQNQNKQTNNKKRMCLRRLMLILKCIKWFRMNIPALSLSLPYSTSCFMCWNAFFPLLFFFSPGKKELISIFYFILRLPF